MSVLWDFGGCVWVQMALRALENRGGSAPFPESPDFAAEMEGGLLRNRWYGIIQGVRKSCFSKRFSFEVSEIQFKGPF